MSRTSDSTNNSDSELMQAYVQGDAAAFDALFIRHGGKIYNFLLRETGDPALAQDLTQETWLRVIRTKDRFKPGSRFTSWLYTIVFNLLRDERKRRQRRGGENHISIHEADAVVDENTRPVDESAEQAEMRDAVQVAVSRLPEEQRRVLLLTKYQGLTFAEAGDILGISEAAARQKAWRGIQTLRNVLKGNQ